MGGSRIEELERWIKSSAGADDCERVRRMRWPWRSNTCGKPSTRLNWGAGNDPSSVRGRGRNVTEPGTSPSESEAPVLAADSTAGTQSPIAQPMSMGQQIFEWPDVPAPMCDGHGSAPRLRLTANRHTPIRTPCILELARRCLWKPRKTRCTRAWLSRERYCRMAISRNLATQLLDPTDDRDMHGRRSGPTGQPIQCAIPERR
jgi:hypothetical protein